MKRKTISVFSHSEKLRSSFEKNSTELEKELEFQFGSFGFRSSFLFSSIYDF